MAVTNSPPIRLHSPIPGRAPSRAGLYSAGQLAGGKTTRETAAALFLSPKTVEYHLRHVYQRLGIHSRDELAERMRHASPAN
jgi:DNA-binding CsgD family transcriptional regulator